MSTKNGASLAAIKYDVITVLGKRFFQYIAHSRWAEDAWHDLSMKIYIKPERKSISKSMKGRLNLLSSESCKENLIE